MKQFYFTSILLCLCLILKAQVPPNDEILNAITITSIPFADIDVQTQNATSASNGVLGGCDIGSLTRIYYRYVPSQDEVVTINIGNGSNNSFVLVCRSSSEYATTDNDLTIDPSSFCEYSDTSEVSLEANQVYYILTSNPNEPTDILFNDSSSNLMVNIPDDNFEQALIDLGYDDILDDYVLRENIESITELNLDFKNIADLTGIEGFVNLEVFNAPFNQLTTVNFQNNGSLRSIYLRYNQLTNIYGLELLDNLLFLQVGDNNLNNINVSNNLLLRSLGLFGNNLESLDISMNSALTSLDADSNNLDDLDISNNLLLTSLGVAGNNISFLDVTLHSDLEKLQCSGNNLSSIDVTQNSNLESLGCGGNNLASIDVTQNSNLESLWCSNNNLTTLDITLNNNLKWLDCTQNDLSVVDFSQCPLLEFLYCSFNPFTQIDVTNNLNLNTFWYSDWPEDGVDIPQADISQNVLLENLHCNQINMTSLDVSHLLNLKELHCSNTLLTELDLSQNLSLEEIRCFNSDLMSINLLENINVREVLLQRNNLTNVDLSNCTNLETLNLSDNNIQSIDLSENTLLNEFSISDNLFLENINIKNGNNTNITNFNASNCTNLSTICVDNVDYAIENFTNIDPLTTFTTDCTSGVDYNEIGGNIVFDDEANGCDSEDFEIANLRIDATDGTNLFSTFTNNAGNYQLSTVINNYIVSIPNVPNYINTNPISTDINFTSFGNSEIVDFCLSPQSSVNDLTVLVLPLNEARPGFDANYQIVYQNLGTEIMDGDLEVAFNETMQTFEEASQIPVTETTNTLTFNYTNLQPFESRTIDITMNIFAPPAVNDGDVLNFTATINPTAGDINPEDNLYNIEQVVVNSFDPNDKQVVQGSEVLIEDIDQYLEYIIRFQNTGTASAINVAITDELSDKLDWNTIQPITASHDYRIEITNGDFVEFIFDDINLPAEQDDTEGSNGYVAFRIKPKQDLAVGDIITGEAKIYFDFNAPIITNTVSTEIVEDTTLTIASFTKENTVTIFPNPTLSNFEVKTKEGIVINTLEVYSVKGEKLMSVTNTTRIDLSDYASGLYFIKVITNNGTVNKRLIKQ